MGQNKSLIETNCAPNFDPESSSGTSASAMLGSVRPLRAECRKTVSPFTVPRLQDRGPGWRLEAELFRARETPTAGIERRCPLSDLFRPLYPQDRTFVLACRISEFDPERTSASRARDGLDPTGNATQASSRLIRQIGRRKLVKSARLGRACHKT